MFDPADPPRKRRVPRADDLRPSAGALTGMTGLGGRPVLHPSWREPDRDTWSSRPARPGTLVIRLKDEPSG